MRIAVIGTGAMGCVYAALFAEAGHDVTAVDAWADHIDAISRNGLRLDGFTGDRVISGISARMLNERLPEAELYILATKADGIADAAAKLNAETPPDAMVLTIQNGMGSADILAGGISSDRILVGVAEGFGASMTGPGHGHHTSMTRIRLGEYGGGETARLAEVTALWQGAGFPAEAYANIDQLIWEKFICNVSLSGPCTITGCTVGELMADPALWRMALDCGVEAYAVGKARGVQNTNEDHEAYVTTFAAKLGGAKPSMTLDHEAGRRSEIDIINGMVPKLAARAGLDAPVNRAVTAIIHHREKSFT